MKGRLSTQEILERCLSTGELAHDVVERLVDSKTPEDLYLDYKGGEIVEKRNAAEIADSVAAFANGDGGLVLLGVNGEDVSPESLRWTIDGCAPAVGKQPVLEWLAACLSPVMPYLHPQPKMGVAVGCPALKNGPVIWIATRRSDLLVPIVKPGVGIVHLLRIHGGKYPAPAYLMADLLMGRRQRPRFMFEESIGVAASFLLTLSKTSNWPAPTVEFALRSRNGSPLWVSDPQAGLIGCGLNMPALDVLPELRGQVAAPDSARLAMRSLSDSKLILPFQPTAAFEVKVKLPDATSLVAAYEQARLRCHGVRTGVSDPPLRYRWRGALFVLCREAPPDWFQVEFGGDVPTDASIAWLGAGTVLRPQGLPRADVVVLAHHLYMDEWVELDDDPAHVLSKVTTTAPTSSSTV